MSLTITIKTASLIQDVKIKSFMNTERMKDPEDRYAARAAEENGAEISECLLEAKNSLNGICRRFLQANSSDTAGNDQYSAQSTDYSFVFDLSVRRDKNIGDALALAMHTYLVNGTLRRFYTSAALPELVSMYVAAENASRDEIINLLYRKLDPSAS